MTLDIYNLGDEEEFTHLYGFTALSYLGTYIKIYMKGETKIICLNRYHKIYRNKKLLFLSGANVSTIHGTILKNKLRQYDIQKEQILKQKSNIQLNKVGQQKRS